jgi:hypothetical protein
MPARSPTRTPRLPNNGHNCSCLFQEILDRLPPGLVFHIVPRPPARAEVLPLPQCHCRTDGTECVNEKFLVATRGDMGRRRKHRIVVKGPKQRHGRPIAAISPNSGACRSGTPMDFPMSASHTVCRPVVRGGHHATTGLHTFALFFGRHSRRRYRASSRMPR